MGTNEGNIMRKMEGKIGPEELGSSEQLCLSPSLLLALPLSLSLSFLHFRLFPLLSSSALPLPASLSFLHRAAVNERVSWVWLHCSVQKGRAALSVWCVEGWCTRRNVFTRCVTVHSLAFSVGKGMSRCVWCRADRFFWQISVMLTKLPGKMCDGECLFPDAIFSCLFLSLCTAVSASKIVVCIFMASKPQTWEHSLDSWFQWESYHGFHNSKILKILKINDDQAPCDLLYLERGGWGSDCVCLDKPLVRPSSHPMRIARTVGSWVKAISCDLLLFNLIIITCKIKHHIKQINKMEEVFIPAYSGKYVSCWRHKQHYTVCFTLIWCNSRLNLCIDT